MTDIIAEAVCDSISQHSPRLLTVRCRYPKFIHGEHLRHRSFSFSVSSSRAIPVAKNLEEVRSDELRAGPVWWGREQKGMSSGEELPNIKNPDDVTSEFYRHGRTELETAQNLWKIAAHYAESCAARMAEIGAHKSIVNRILEPFLHVNVLVTGTEPGWMNFFGLRLDKAAQPEIRVLAEACWKVWNESVPRQLSPGEWHLPYIDPKSHNEILEYNRFPGQDNSEEFDENGILLISREVSTARCARLSYLSFETQRRSTIEEDLKLYERLIGSLPIHASPAEHQATPDEPHYNLLHDNKYPGAIQFMNEDKSGNLGPGWIQFRKLLPQEAIAPLPQHLSQGQRHLVETIISRRRGFRRLAHFPQQRNQSDLNHRAREINPRRVFIRQYHHDALPCPLYRGFRVRRVLCKPRPQLHIHPQLYL